MTLDSRLLGLLVGRRRGVLATLRRDGRPQMSTVGYAWDPERHLIRVSTRNTLAKTHNLRRDQRATLHVGTEDMSSYVVVEGDARLTPVATDEHDATVEELVELYRTIRGEHPDWADYRSAMVAEQRLIIHVTVTNAYGYLA